MPSVKPTRRRRSLGREFFRDDRDQFFAVRVGRTTGRKHWSEGRIWLQQPDEPICVGVAWTHWLLGSPVMGQYVDPKGIYLQAQRVDEWEGEEYEGTSVRAGAKVLQELGFIERYEWATTVDALISTVLRTGPVVVGTNWYSGMDAPTEAARWEVKGRVLGGHAWNITGVDTHKELFRTRNGHLGNARGWISIEDMARLLAEDGEACQAIERKARPR